MKDSQRLADHGAADAKLFAEFQFRREFGPRTESLFLNGLSDDVFNGLAEKFSISKWRE